MLFTDEQVKLLFLRLRQTKEELLYDVNSQQVKRYSLTRRDGEILGVAHCDFVEDAWSYPEFIGDSQSIIRAGQVDDRVGVWLLLDVLPSLPGMPTFDILLTTDEEIGRSSAQEVSEDLRYNWTFQFDRRGTDFVDYSMASRKFTDAFRASTGIPHGIGSFSDICYLPSSCGSRVNIGTGYHDEHCPDAFVDLDECSSQVERFADFARAFASTRFAVKQQSRRPVKSLSMAFDYWSLKEDCVDGDAATPDIMTDFDNWK